MNDAAVMRRPALTLVIPAYNRGHLIAETIDMALSQSVPFAEIIVVDDGSTDDTPRVLASYGARIRMIRTPNGGVQAARNTGVAAARTDHVTLCDSDDLLERNFVQVVSDWLGLRDDIDILFANFCTFNERGLNPDKFSLAPPGWFDGAQRDGDFLWDIPGLYGRTVKYQPLFPTGMTFRTRFYREVGGYDTRFNRVGAEDWEFTLRAIAAGKVALCRLPLMRIRKHSGNDSGNPVTLLMGEAKILEHALINHQAAAGHADQIRSSIESRRLDAFNHAYAAGDFQTTRTLLSLMRRPGLDARFLLKKLISGLPDGLRQPVWAMTQR